MDLWGLQMDGVFFFFFGAPSHSLSSWSWGLVAMVVINSKLGLFLANTLGKRAFVCSFEGTQLSLDLLV